MAEYLRVYSCGKVGDCPVDCKDDFGYCVYDKFCSCKKLLGFVVILE